MLGTGAEVEALKSAIGTGQLYASRVAELRNLPVLGLTVVRDLGSMILNHIPPCPKNAMCPRAGY
jgi:hypothetical protein